MLRSLLARLASAFTRGEGDVDGGEDGDSAGESGFGRSRLDVSVLYAHGADVTRLEREIADIEEQAREIEDGVADVDRARRDRER